MSTQQERDKESIAKLIDDSKDEAVIRAFQTPSGRSNLLSNYEFSRNFSRALMAARVYDFNQLLSALARLYSRFYEKSDIDSPLGILEYRLKQNGFSSRFVEIFERVAFRKIGRSEDVVTMHTSSDMSLTTLVKLEEVINQLFREAIISDDVASKNIRSQKDLDQIIRVRSFTHPASTEVFFDPVTVALTGTAIMAASGAIMYSFIKAGEQTRSGAETALARLKSMEEDDGDETEQMFEDMPDEEFEEGERIKEVEPETLPVKLALIESSEPVNELQNIVEELMDKPTSISATKSGLYVVGLEQKR